MSGHGANVPGLWRVHRYDYGQEAVLSLIERNSHALDLAKSNPVLLWLIACAQAEGSISHDYAARLINRKQLVILQTLYPKNHALSVSLVRKIQPARYDEDDWACLEMILPDEVFAPHLRHYTRICLPSLNVFLPYDGLLRVPLVRSCIESGECLSDFCFQVRATALRGWQHGQSFNHNDPWGAMAQCTTYPQLRSLVERWERNASSVGNEPLILKSSIMGVFPPIAPGALHIEPITSLMGLLIEGQDMNHCVNDYDTEVMAGEATAYRLLSPQRGTLLLGRDPDGFAIMDFKLANNKEPSEESWGAVRSWLRRLNRADFRHPKTGLPATRQAPLPA